MRKKGIEPNEVLRFSASVLRNTACRTDLAHAGQIYVCFRSFHAMAFRHIFLFLLPMLLLLSIYLFNNLIF